MTTTAGWPHDGPKELSWFQSAPARIQSLGLPWQFPRFLVGDFASQASMFDARALEGLPFWNLSSARPYACRPRPWPRPLQETCRGKRRGTRAARLTVKPRNCRLSRAGPLRRPHYLQAAKIRIDDPTSCSRYRSRRPCLQHLRARPQF